MYIARKFLANNLLCLGIGMLLLSCQAGQPRAPKPVVSAPNKADSVKSIQRLQDRIVVYYFHGNTRCPTCFKLERFAKSVIEGDFSEAVASGKLEWRAVNIEDAGNEHFTNDYKLYSKAVIVSTIKAGKEVAWKNLDQIWQLVRDEGKYREYIKREVQACLAGKCL